MSGHTERSLAIAVFLFFLFSVTSGTIAVESGERGGEPLSIALEPQETNEDSRGTIDELLADDLPGCSSDPGETTVSAGWFTENQGQFRDPDILYMFSSPDYSIGFMRGGYQLDLTRGDGSGSVIGVSFEGSSPVDPLGMEEISHRSNYFLGCDPGEWRTRVPNYQSLIYKGLYPGIDLVFHGTEDGLKYDLTVAPGGDPSAISFSYEGIDSLGTDDEGNLIVYAGGMVHMEDAPYTYQVVEGEMIEVESRYSLGSHSSAGSRRLSFELGDFDTGLPLIIDPLIFSTFLGGGDGDGGTSIAVDTGGFVYVAGYTRSADFPNTTGAYDTDHNGGRDVFVLKLTPDGSDLIYSTFIGGSGNEGGDEGENELEDAIDLTVDGSNNVYVAGATGSEDFPTTSGGFSRDHKGGEFDLFVLKLNAEGSDLVYSTYVGGSDDDSGSGVSIALDRDLNAMVASGTGSWDFPTTITAYDRDYHGNGDVVLFRLNEDGSDLLYSTFIGGRERESARGITLDAIGNIYLTGSTASGDYPTYPGSYDEEFNGVSDVFVTKLNAEGTVLIYSTFIGGSGKDTGYDLVLDNEDRAIITGGTTSSDFPMVEGAYQEGLSGDADAFLAILSPAGSQLEASGFLGGSDEDRGTGVMLDPEGNILITGTTWSRDFPTTPDCFDEQHDEEYSEGFVCRFTPDAAELQYSSFLGGSKEELLGDLWVDGEHNVYLTGSTGSPNFPVSPGAYDDSYNGSVDAYVLRLNLLTANITSIDPVVALTSDEITMSGKGLNGGTITDYHWFSSIDGELYLGPDQNITISDLNVGNHSILLRVKDDLGYWSDDVSTILTVHERPVAHIDFIMPSPALETDTVSFQGRGTDDGTIEQYVWRSNLDGELSNGTESDFMIDGLRNGSHIIYLRVRDNYGVWSRETSANLTVNGIPRARIVSILPDPANEGDTVIFIGNGTDDGTVVNYSWRSNRDEFLSNRSSFSTGNLTNGTHIIYFQVTDDMGIRSQEMTLKIHINGIPRAVIESILPDHPNEGDRIEFIGNWTDDGSVVEYLWRSSVDGYLSNRSSFSSTSLSVENHTISFKVTDEYGVESDEVLMSVRVNGIPVARIVNIDPEHSYEGDTVSFTGSGLDDGTLTEFRWESSKDGVLSTNMSFSFSGLSNGTHIIRYRVWDEQGVPSETVTEKIMVNGIPRAFIENIDPKRAYEGELITFRGNGTDDGNISGYRWISSIDGILGNSSTMYLTNLTPGVHRISFKVMDDSGTWSASASETITIDVRATPVIIFGPHPKDLYPGDHIEIVTNYTGHEKTITVRIANQTGSLVFFESRSIGENGLSSFHFGIPVDADPGNYSVVAYTGNASAGSLFRVMETVVNRAPVIDGTPFIISDDTLSSEGPFLSMSNLSGRVQARDPEGDPLEITFVWIVNDNPVFPESGPDMNDARFPRSHFLKGDEVRFQVSVSDGISSTVAHSNSIIIINTPPTITNSVVLPESPRTDRDLSLSYVYFDFDGDTEDGTTIQWLVNRGIGWEPSPFTGSLVPANETAKGQQWKCIIVPGDGVQPGEHYETGHITIGNTQPEVVISSPVRGDEYLAGREILFDGRSSSDADDDELDHLWRIDGVSISSERFYRNLTAGYHVIELSAWDGTETATQEFGLMIRTGPDLLTRPSESYLSNCRPDGTGQVGTELAYTVFIWNQGDIEATATVEFYVEGTERVLIGQKVVRVPVQGFDTAFVTWNPDREGNVTFLAMVVGSSPSESDETNNIAFMNLTLTPAPVHPEPSPDRTPVVIVSTVSVGLVGAAIAGYEPWKYRFFAFLIPLYTKLNHDNRMDNENRSKILGFIMGVEEGKRETNGQPGVSYSTIKKKLNFSNGALAYHLSVLEREGDIRSEKVGKFRLYFPKKISKPQTMFLERLTELQQRLVQEMRKHSEISQKKLVRSMMESQQVISYNLNRLEQKGIVFLKKRGNRSYCRLNPEYANNSDFL